MHNAIYIHHNAYGAPDGKRSAAASGSYVKASVQRLLLAVPLNPVPRAFKTKLGDPLLHVVEV